MKKVRRLENTKNWHGEVKGEKTGVAPHLTRDTAESYRLQWRRERKTRVCAPTKS